MQAKLPDINSAFVKYRTHALECIASRNYNGATAALNNINALFPDEYRVAISDSEYSQAVRNKVYYQCTNCKKETPPSEVRVMNIYNTFIVETLTGNKTSKIWFCPECNAENNLKSTVIVKEKMKEPYYLKVIPTRPVGLSGLMTRLGFHQKFSVWFYKFLEELECQIGLYRIEYASQMEDDWDPDFKDGGDQ